MKKSMRLIILTKLILGATSLFSFANADGLKSIGKPIPGGMGFQPAVTELARDLQWLDGMVNIIIIAISLFVTVLLLWAAYRYNKKKESKSSHIYSQFNSGNSLDYYTNRNSSIYRCLFSPHSI